MINMIISELLYYIYSFNFGALFFGITISSTINMRTFGLSSMLGVPSPGPWTKTNMACGLLGTGLPSRRWVAGEWAKLHLYLQPLPTTCVTTWVSPSVRSVVALDSHRSMNTTVNCICEGSRCVIAGAGAAIFWPLGKRPRESGL